MGKLTVIEEQNGTFGQKVVPETQENLDNLMRMAGTEYIEFVKIPEKYSVDLLEKARASANRELASRSQVVNRTAPFCGVARADFIIHSFRDQSAEAQRQKRSARASWHNREMAIRNEWTEWHLTPEGWQRGSTRVQGKGNTWEDEPETRVLSFVYKEVATSSAPGAVVSSEETWRSKTATDIDALMRQHGPSPRHL